ncbi:hypothetical protein [Szabonella alba]|uniref:Uncharacterized protein n=1 Tax=Szabonella alba TaxID=2804194 RepID=A0A8K0V5K4_9RHOB|nr:hypothetical protein [Szabonella alba]MBL4915803.1 hypothetical protein [Szabonella alba]
MTLFRSAALLILMAVPASAGGPFLDLPNLTWPEQGGAETGTTTSTMQGATTAN